MIKLIRLDIKEGIVKSLYKFLLFVPLIAYICINLIISNISWWKFSGATRVRFTIMDFYLEIFKGMREYIPNMNEPFQFPIIYLSLNLLIAYIIGDYAGRDLRGRGKNILVRSQKRSLWWYSKCIWNSMSVMIAYSVIFLMVLFFSITNGRLSFSPNSRLLSEYFGLMQNISQIRFISYLIILPLLASIALSQLQMMITIIIPSIYGYFIMAVIFMASAYYFHPFMIGNFFMLYRNALYRSDGIRFLPSVIICLVIIVVSIGVGRFYFEKKDII